MQTMTQPAQVRRLVPADAHLMQALNALFGEAFEDADTYGGAPPSLAYIEGLLAKEHVIALVALEGEEVTGGLVAYLMDKFERARRACRKSPRPAEPGWCSSRPTIPTRRPSRSMRNWACARKCCTST
jgi:hypothetical protein